jgi:hypothetical protein
MWHSMRRDPLAAFRLFDCDQGSIHVSEVYDLFLTL